MTKNKIKYFKNLIQYIKYLKEIQGMNKYINKGSEGACFLSKDEQSVYKIIASDLPKILGYNLDTIITTNDIDLKHFALPEELYAVDKKLIGYKARYINPDLFDYHKIYEDNNYIYKVNFDILLKAYFDILKEIEKISKENIKVYDLTHNIIFTGENLVAIDTCGYKRVETNPFDYNKFALGNAIREKFDWWLVDNISDEENEIFDQYIKNDETDKYLQELNRLVKKLKR